MEELMETYFVDYGKNIINPKIEKDEENKKTDTPTRNISPMGGSGTLIYFAIPIIS